MWLTVEHVTQLGYDEPIVEAYTEVRLKPAHRDGQRCSAFSLTTEPRGATVQEYVDRFGNVVHHFDVLEAHERLAVVARSEVWTPARYIADAPTPPPLDHWDFLAPSRYVPVTDALTELAAAADGDADARATAIALMGAVRGAMTYERGTTDVHTTATEALGDGRGVCQDFAHLAIGALRAVDIPARYVSGYLHPKRDAAIGEKVRGESHAWVEWWTGDWFGFDPTNDREVGDHHVVVGRGREYGDVPPLTGVVAGSTKTLNVTVDITQQA